MLTAIVILILAAFICALASIPKPERVPLWVAVLLLCIVELIAHLPR